MYSVNTFRGHDCCLIHSENYARWKSKSRALLGHPNHFASVRKHESGASSRGNWKPVVRKHDSGSRSRRGNDNAESLQANVCADVNTSPGGYGDRDGQGFGAGDPRLRGEIFGSEEKLKSCVKLGPCKPIHHDAVLTKPRLLHLLQSIDWLEVRFCDVMHCLGEFP